MMLGSLRRRCHASPPSYQSVVMIVEAGVPVAPRSPIAVKVNGFFMLNLPSMSITELLLELYIAIWTVTGTIWECLPLPCWVAPTPMVGFAGVTVIDWGVALVAAMTLIVPDMPLAVPFPRSCP